MHISLHSEAFISVGTLSDSLRYLRRLREAQKSLSAKYISKIPTFNRTKFFHSFWSSWQSAKSLDTFEWLNIGTAPGIHFLHYRKYDFSIGWLCPHSKIAPDTRIHKVSPCSLPLKLFFSCPKVFYIMSECPLDWIHPLVSARNYYGYLHPGCYPRSSAWWHCCACLLYQSELLLSQLFQQILWQSLQSLVKAVETPPTPKRLWSFQCLRAKPLHYNFQRGPIFDIQLATSFLKRKRYIGASSYNLIWIIIYHLWWCTCAWCIRHTLVVFKSKA